jgi:hypothetical protein
LHEIYTEKSSGKKITRRIMGSMKNPTKLLTGISLCEDYLVPNPNNPDEEIEKTRHFCGTIKIINNSLYPNNKEMVLGKVSTATGLSGHEILKMYEVAKKNGKTTERKIDGQLSTKRDYISNNYLANTVIEE